MIAHVHKDFLGIQSLVQKQKSCWCLFKQTSSKKIQVIPQKGNHTPRKPEKKKEKKTNKKTKHHEVTLKVEFYLNE